MITIRKSRDRGHANHGWLDTYHSFSFADYFDPNHMGFRSLRVLNEDVVAPGMGFPKHGHRDMEILTWILAGALRHEDSLGNGSTIRPGEIQYMSAGRGVMHSEANPGANEKTHLIQIWIVPSENGAVPRYGQTDVTRALANEELVLLASPDGAAGSISIRQDARLFAARATKAREIVHELAPRRGAWLHVARGSARLNETALAAGDAAAIERETRLQIQLDPGSEVLLFDMA